MIADQPVSDEVPRQGVPLGPRLVGWEERAPASLTWVEALDGGDPMAPAEYRDRVFRLTGAFDQAPQRVLDVRHRCLGWYDLDAPGQVLMVEHDRDRRWLTTWWCDLNAPQESRAVFDRSVDDAYGDPGAPLRVTNPDGTQTVLADGTAIYLRGDGATPAGKRPFLDRFDLATGATTRLHESPQGTVEHVLGFTSAGRDEVVLWHESPAEPPNLIVAGLGGSESRPLTRWPDPHPQLTRVTKRLFTHDRGDGVTLSGMLYLPPGHDPAVHGRLPLVIWAYPYDFGGADTAGQIRADSFEFTRVTALGPVVFTLRGYAVLADATMPVIGDPETMNDTYLEQVTGAAQAHIRALDEAGIIDPARVAVGGHSYGGFMTANLLAHTTAFAAGIARSGAYNRTLTPFGFQTERRSYWEAAERLRPGFAVPVRGPDHRAAAADPRRAGRQLGDVSHPVGTAVPGDPRQRGHRAAGDAAPRGPRLSRQGIGHARARRGDRLAAALARPGQCRAPPSDEPGQRAERPNVNPAVIGAVFAVIFIGELPDKTMVASLVMSTRGHPFAVWLGSAGAFVVHVVIATTLGTVVFHLLAPQVVAAVVAVIFLVGAGLAVLEAIREHRRKGHPEPPPVPPPRPGRTAATAFAVIFAAEWGDLTQLLTANLAAHYRAPLSVATGAILALWTVSAIAVTGGRWLGSVIDAVAIRIGTAVLLAGLGGYAAWTALR